MVVSGHIVTVAKIALVLTLVASSVAAAQDAASAYEDPAVRAQMTAFVRAREFGDLTALRQFHSAATLNVVEDSARNRAARFMALNPSSRLAATDPAFKQFVGNIISVTPSNQLLETLARAYNLTRQGDSENEAALIILSWSDRFAFSPLVVSGTSFSFARFDNGYAIYYLSENWVIPVSNEAIPKRFVVRWYLSQDRMWRVVDVREPGS